MALAILSGLFILLLYSQGTCAQQSLNTNLNLGINSPVSLPQQPVQRSTAPNNQNPTSPCLNFNSPQHSNVQHLPPQSFNMQQPNVQQTCNLQQQLNSQSSSSTTSSQTVRQQNQFQNGENSFASLANTRFSGLNFQAPQGTSSGPSLSPSPSLQITSYSFKPNVELASLGQPQNQFGNIFAIPASVVNKSQASNAPSVSIESSKNQPTFTFQTISSPTQNSIPQNQQTVTLNSIPTAQNQFFDVKNQVNQPQPYYTPNQALNLVQNQPENSAQSQQTVFTVQNQPGLTSEQNQPAAFTMQSQKGLNSVQIQPTVFTVQNQPSLNSVQNQPALFSVQGQPVLTSMQSQPLLTSVQSQPVVYNMVQGQPVLTPGEVQPITSVQGDPPLASQENQMPLVSVLMSQLLSPSPNPYGKVSTFLNPVVETKQGSKSSGLKALLPLIFNLFKEKSSGCGCRHCGCMNNNCNRNVQEPQICGGYSNQKNYSHRNITNDRVSNKPNDDSEEFDSRENWKQQNYKNNIISNDSTETSEEDDAEYADDYDNED